MTQRNIVGSASDSADSRIIKCLSQGLSLLGLPLGQTAHNFLCFCTFILFRLVFFCTEMQGCRRHWRSFAKSFEPWSMWSSSTCVGEKQDGCASHGPCFLVIEIPLCHRSMSEVQCVCAFNQQSTQAWTVGESGVKLWNSCLQSFGNWFFSLSEIRLSCLDFWPFSSLPFSSIVLKCVVLIPGARQGNESLTSFCLTEMVFAFLS